MRATCSPLDLYARVRTFLCTLHTRPRVQRAPGLPCALIGRELRSSLGRALRREIADAYSVSSPGLTGRPSIPETAVIESMSRGVLDAPLSRSMTVFVRRQSGTLPVSGDAND